MNKDLCDMTLEELCQLFPIILKEHNEAYKNWYEFEKDKLLTYIDSQAVIRINHIGSSYVKGLISKPTVDILLEISKASDINEITNILSNKGWILMSSRDTPSMQRVFNKGYTKEGFAEKVYHLHVRYYDNWNELYFRDYLVDHEEIAKEYGKLKLSLLDEFKYNRDGYTNAKREFVLKYTEKAKLEYGNRYNTVDINIKNK